jgi:hypothetical protein
MATILRNMFFKMSYLVYRFWCPNYFGIGSIFGTCKNLGFGHSLFLSKTYIINQELRNSEIILAIAVVEVSKLSVISLSYFKNTHF